MMKVRHLDQQDSMSLVPTNKTSDNVSYLVDNKKCLCQHGKLHPLIAIMGKCISETMYRYVEKSFNKTHIDTSLQRKMKVYQLRK